MEPRTGDRVEFRFAVLGQHADVLINGQSLAYNLDGFDILTQAGKPTRFILYGPMLDEDTSEPLVGYVVAKRDMEEFRAWREQAQPDKHA